MFTCQINLLTVTLFSGSGPKSSFLSIFNNERQKATFCQKCLMSLIGAIFDINSNHFGQVIPKNYKSFEKLDRRVTTC